MAEATGPAQSTGSCDGRGMAIIEDATFLGGWGRGRIPTLAAFVCARPVLRANPYSRRGFGGRARRAIPGLSGQGHPARRHLLRGALTHTVSRMTGSLERAGAGRGFSILNVRFLTRYQDNG